MGFIANMQPSIFKGLTDKMCIFCQEYPLDLDHTRAAREAGYKNPEVAGLKLLQSPKVKKALQKLVAPQLKKAGLTQERVLEQLYNFFFRNVLPFLDSEGNLKCKLSELPEELQQCVESIKVKRRKRYFEDGQEEVEEDIQLEFVRKTALIDPIMKYLGMLPPPNVTQQFNANNQVFSWEGLLEAANAERSNVIEAIPIEEGQDGEDG